MSEEIPIEIHVKAIVEGAEEVKGLVESLEKLQSIAGELGTTLQKTGAQGKASTEAMEGLSKLSPEAEEVARKLNKIRDVGVQQDLIRIAQESDSLSEFLRRSGIEAKYLGEETSRTKNAVVEAAQAEGVYVEGLERTSTSLKNQLTLMNFKKRLLNSLLVSDRNKAAAVEYLTQAYNGDRTSAEGVVEAYTALQNRGFTLRSSIEAVTRSIDAASEKGLSHNIIMRELMPVYAGILRSAGLSRQEIAQFSVALGQSGEEAKKVLTHFYRLRTALNQVAQMNREYTASLGAAGVALEEFTRNIFWAGLGVMFNTMSIARMLRRQTQMSTQAYSVARAVMSLKDAQKAENEAIMEYGPASEEAIEAHRRVIESEYALKSARDSARASIQQYYLSWFMLIWGMLPNLMYVGQSVLKFYQQMKIASASAVGAHIEEKAATDQLAASQTSLAGTGISAAVSTGTLAGTEGVAAGTATTTAGANEGLAASNVHVGMSAMIASIGMKMLIGAATMGIGILVTYAATQYLVSQQMEQMNEEMQRIQEEFGYTSDSIDNVIGGSGLIELNEKLENYISLLKQVPPLEEIKVVIPEVKTPEVEVPEEIEQKIVQEVVPAQIEEPPEITQYVLIEEKLVPVEIPKLEDKEQNIVQKLTPVSVPSVEDQTQEINQILNEVNIPEVEDQEQYIIQYLIKADIPEPEPLEQEIYQKVIAPEEEERRGILVLSTQNEVSIKNIRTRDFVGQGLELQEMTSRLSRVRALNADNVSGGFGPSDLELQYLRFAAEQSAYLVFLPYILLKTGGLWGLIIDAAAGISENAFEDFKETRAKFEEIGSFLGTEIGGTTTAIGTQTENLQGTLVSNTETITNPLGKLEDIKGNTNNTVGNLVSLVTFATDLVSNTSPENLKDKLQTIIDTAVGIAVLINEIGGVMKGTSDFFGGIIKGIQDMGQTVAGGLLDLYNIMGGHSVSVDIKEFPSLPELGSNTQTFNINIYNPVVRNETDIYTLAREIKNQIVRGVQVR